MPVFLERFILTVLSAVFAGYVLGNLLGLGLMHRVSLGVVVASAAYLISVAVHRWKKPTETETPSGKHKKSILPKTLHRHFREDFSQYLSVDFEKSLATPGGEKIATAAVRVYFNYDASVKFVAYHIPKQGEAAYKMCAALAKLCGAIADEPNTQIEANSMSPGDSAWKKSADLKFTGSVYVYHEDDFSLEQLGQLEKEYKAYGLSPQFRGQQYATAKWLQARAIP